MKVDVSKYQEIADGYAIMSVPALKFFCSGRPVSEIVGGLNGGRL